MYIQNFTNFRVTKFRKRRSSSHTRINIDNKNVFLQIFPAVVREFGVAFSIFIEELIKFVQDFIDYTNIQILDYKAVMIVRISYCFIPVGIIFSYLFIPETKDLTLARTEKLARNLNTILRGKYGNKD